MYRITVFKYNDRYDCWEETRYINDDGIDFLIGLIKKEGYVGSFEERCGLFSAKTAFNDLFHPFETWIRIERCEELWTEDMVRSFIPSNRRNEHLEIKPGFFVRIDEECEEEYANREEMKQAYLRMLDKREKEIEANRREAERERKRKEL